MKVGDISNAHKNMLTCWLVNFNDKGIDMSSNNKQTSQSVASLAAETLKNPNASQIQKTLAGSALAQANTSKQTSGSVESTASKALHSDKYNQTTKTLAGSVLSALSI